MATEHMARAVAYRHRHILIIQHVSLAVYPFFLADIIKVHTAYKYS